MTNSKNVFFPSSFIEKMRQQRQRVNNLLQNIAETVDDVSDLAGDINQVTKANNNPVVSTVTPHRLR